MTTTITVRGFVRPGTQAGNPRASQNGELEDQEVEIEVEDTSTPRLEFFDGAGMQEMELNMQDLLGGLLPKRTKKKRVPVREARKLLAQEEAGNLLIKIP